MTYLRPTECICQKENVGNDTAKNNLLYLFDKY